MKEPEPRLLQELRSIVSERDEAFNLTDEIYRGIHGAFRNDYLGQNRELRLSVYDNGILAFERGEYQVVCSVIRNLERPMTIISFESPEIIKVLSIGSHSSMLMDATVDEWRKFPKRNPFKAHRLLRKYNAREPNLEDLRNFRELLDVIKTDGKADSTSGNNE